MLFDIATLVLGIFLYAGSFVVTARSRQFLLLLMALVFVVNTGYNLGLKTAASGQTHIEACR